MPRTGTDDFCDRCGKHHTPSCAEMEWADYQRRNPGPAKRIEPLVRHDDRAAADG